MSPGSTDESVNAQRAHCSEDDRQLQSQQPTHSHGPASTHNRTISERQKALAFRTVRDEPTRDVAKPVKADCEAKDRPETSPQATMSPKFPEEAIKAHRKDHIEHDPQLQLFTSSHNSFASMEYSDVFFKNFQAKLIRQAVYGEGKRKGSRGSGFFGLPIELRDTIYDYVAAEEEIIVKIVLRKGEVPHLVSFARGGLKDTCSKSHHEYSDAIVRRVKTLMTKRDNHGRTLFNAVTVPQARVVLERRASRPCTTTVIGRPVQGILLSRPRWSTDGKPFKVPHSPGITVVLHPTTEDHFRSVYSRKGLVCRDFQSFKLSIEFESDGFHDTGHLMLQSAFPVLIKHMNMEQTNRRDLNDDQEVPLNGITSRMNAVCNSVEWSGYDTQEILNLRLQHPHSERYQTYPNRDLNTREEEVKSHNPKECTLPQKDCFICNSVFEYSDHDDSDESAECGCRRCMNPEKRMYREYPLIPRPSVCTFVRYCINHFETPYFPFEGYVYESDPANEEEGMRQREIVLEAMRATGASVKARKAISSSACTSRLSFV